MNVSIFGASGMVGAGTSLECLDDARYGMREVIVRDLNLFWRTFGQPIALDRPAT